MSFEETEGIGRARGGKGVRDVEGQWAPTSVPAVTEAALGEARWACGGWGTQTGICYVMSV